MCDIPDKLRQAVEAGHVLVVVGTGVSIDATKGNDLASWTGLLKNGVQKCIESGEEMPDDEKKRSTWERRVLEEIDSDDMDDLLSAAEKISAKLGAHSDGSQFSIWLRRVMEKLTVVDDTLIKAICELDFPIATTNYDRLLEKVTQRPSLVWSDEGLIVRFLQGDESAILHLHGHYLDTPSVVLGIRAYDKVTGNVQAQNFLHSAFTTKRLLFIGTRDGLCDPNIGGLWRWGRNIYRDFPYDHFVLARCSECDRLRKRHGADRLQFVNYGDNHGDLVPFLRSLAKIRSAQRTSIPSPSKAILPKPPMVGYCECRETETDDLVGELLAFSPRPTIILGTLGVGKSTIARKALHDTRVRERYKERLYFVRCDAQTSRDGIVTALADALGVVPSEHVEEQALAALGQSPAVLALDNVDDAWNADTKSMEELFSQLAVVPGVALVVSMRGEQKPWGTAWREPIRVRPFDQTDSKRAFLAMAGEKFKDDPLLEGLLKEVDHLPIFVAALARLADGQADLQLLAQRWPKDGAAMLTSSHRGVRNVDVSIEKWINSVTTTSDTRRLLSLFYFLPDGILRPDLNSYLPECGEKAAFELIATGVVIGQVSRICVLNSIRDYLGRSGIRPSTEDAQRIESHLFGLAMHGSDVGTQGGAAIAQKIALQLANIEATIRRRLSSEDPIPAIDAACALSRFSRFIGLGRPELVLEAAQRAELLGDKVRDAMCRLRAGHLEMARGNYAAARRCYDDAFALYSAIPGPAGQKGQADSIKRFADIAAAKPDPKGAHAKFLEALELYKTCDDVRGQASCYAGLGELAFNDAQLDGAADLYVRAMDLFAAKDYVLGQANCVAMLGDIALLRSQNNEAQRQYKAARSLFREIGGILGEADCLSGLHEIALARKKPRTALKFAGEASDLYAKVHKTLENNKRALRLRYVEKGAVRNVQDGSNS